ncbi:hypothetical protein D3C85_678820 [compost metagenome]
MAGDNRKQPGHSWRANALAWTQAVRESRIESRRLATELAIVEAVLARQPVRVLDRSAEIPGTARGQFCGFPSRPRGILSSSLRLLERWHEMPVLQWFPGTLVQQIEA